MARTGTVIEFDDHVGLGVIEGDDGARLPFHCAAIADGSRTVAVGASVRYDVMPGNRGVWEAARVEPA